MSLLVSICSALALLITLKNTTLSQLIDDKHLQHRLFGASAIIFVLWVLRVGIVEGLYIHFLWLTSLSLLVGFRLSFIAASTVLLGASVVGLYPINMFGVNLFISVLLPILVSYSILSLSFHKMERHVFIYIFVCAFFASGLAIALKMFAQGLYFYFEQGLAWDEVKHSYLNIIPLVIFPEALFNGMIMTLLIIYKPHWVYTFHDKFYINDK